jgi:hypothetical protein
MPEPHCLVEYREKKIFTQLHNSHKMAHFKVQRQKVILPMYPYMTISLPAYHKMADTTEKIRQTKEEDVSYTLTCNGYLETTLKTPSAFTVDSQHQNSTTYTCSNVIFLMNINRKKNISIHKNNEYTCTGQKYGVINSMYVMKHILHNISYIYKGITVKNYLW